MGKHHGLSNTREYRAWYNMLYRCYNPKHVSFSVYGAKGVRVCKRWHDFLMFQNDMGACPPGMSLDRKNGKRGYSKNNCRWATRAEQNVNRKTTRLTEADVRAIRVSTTPPNEAAAHYKVNSSHIRGIRAGRTWRHVL